MKAVILAGGLGSRLSEETTLKPKPMVEIGGKPILWHIMKIYSAQGISDFIICLGYKGHTIKEYFSNYFLHNSDIIFDTAQNKVEVVNSRAENWRVLLLDTGVDSMTGGRLKRALPFIEDEVFCLTYGDGVSDTSIPAAIDLHQKAGTLATVTAVQRPGRFGMLNLAGDTVSSFYEKPHGDEGWINGGFFVLSRAVDHYIDGDTAVLEREPMERLAADGQLAAYKHTGFWKPMDTLRDKIELDAMWQAGDAPWRIW